MGRKLIIKEGLENMIHILIDGNLKKELAEEAKAKGLPLNTYIRCILIDRHKYDKE